MRGGARRRLLGLAALGLAAPIALIALAGAPAPAHAYIPPADRVLGAVAQHNRAAGRTQPLRLELVLRPDVSGAPAGEREPIARGELVTHPTGLARLELRGAGGLVERHVLQGGEHLATRNGSPLRRPRAFLPPLFLLQTDSQLGLLAGLDAIGADTGAIGLAPCGESDCYVIGDPGRVPPPGPGEVPPAPPDAPGDAGATGTLLDLRDRLGMGRRSGPFGTLWVDLASFEIKRIDQRDGVRIWLGPPASFGRVQAPAWIRIDEPGKQPVRFDVIAAEPVDAPAAAFSRTWLEAPLPPGAPAPGAEATGSVPHGPGEAPQDPSGENY